MVKVNQETVLQQKGKQMDDKSDRIISPLLYTQSKHKNKILLSIAGPYFCIPTMQN